LTLGADAAKILAVATIQRSPSLPATLRLGGVHLTVTDVDRAIAWYERALGLQLTHREGDTAVLGTEGDELITLVADPDAQQPGRHAGLYHYALLYPSRAELASAAIRLAATRTPIQGASDHGTHEAIYLPDADGNGIELAADRPRDQWPEVGSRDFYTGGPQPLDVDALLAVVDGEQPRAQAEPGQRVGHLHLHVGDVDEGLTFYSDVVGFDLIARLPSAAFVSAGGYHHHLGFNVWRGEGVPPAPAEHVVGLRHWTVLLPSDEDAAALRERLETTGHRVEVSDGGFIVRDPWNNALLVTRAN